VKDYLCEDKLPAPVALKVLSKVTAAVAYMHARRWAHRDIKATNVLFDDDADVVKLIDLGYAEEVALRRLDDLGPTEPVFSLNFACGACGAQNLRKPRGAYPMYQCMVCPFAERLFCDAVGTPIYMALEILDNRPCSALRTDVYALGVLGTEMFYGRQEIPGFEEPAQVTTLNALKSSRRSVGIPIPVGLHGIEPGVEQLLREMTSNRAPTRPILTTLFKTPVASKQ
jgi:serine/threonine protein kinase